jgi:hypothetical protein
MKREAAAKHSINSALCQVGELIFPLNMTAVRMRMHRALLHIVCESMLALLYM